MGMKAERGHIIALRNEKGSYNKQDKNKIKIQIIALRNEKGSYNIKLADKIRMYIIALRNEKGSYNRAGGTLSH